MIIVAAILASLPIVLGVYAYVVYPAALRVIAAVRVGHLNLESAPSLPVVTIVVPAYNEGHQIRATIEALLAQDYPSVLRQILVLSDASTDDTDAVVMEYVNRGVELLRMEARSGKTAAENASIPMIRGSIVVNTDASVRLDPAAVRRLVEAMRDPSVGVASTRDVSVTSSAAANRAEGSYVGYEMRIRTLETRTGGIVGASGSGYAIRLALHKTKVREDLSRDFSAALTAYRNGFVAVSVEDAVCYVPRSLSLEREYRRKVRTISRGMETLYFNRDLLDPIVHGWFAWKLWSHKICRWLVPISAVPAAIGLVFLASEFPIMTWFVGIAALLAVLAIVGARWPDGRTLPAWLPGGVLGLLAANLAVLHSAWRFAHGHHDHVWEPTRRPLPLA